MLSIVSLTGFDMTVIYAAVAGVLVLVVAIIIAAFVGKIIVPHFHFDLFHIIFCVEF